MPLISINSRTPSGGRGSQCPLPPLYPRFRKGLHCHDAPIHCHDAAIQGDPYKHPARRNEASESSFGLRAWEQSLGFRIGEFAGAPLCCS